MGHGWSSMHGVSEVVHAGGDGEEAPAGVRGSVPRLSPTQARADASARRPRRAARGRAREHAQDGHELAALVGRRLDERGRQQKHREATRSGTCHEPPSDGKSSELLSKLREIVDKGARLSRATFLRDAGRILRESGIFLGAALDRAGRCHEPPSAMKTAENGSRSVVGVDGVTDRDGS